MARVTIDQRQFFRATNAPEGEIGRWVRATALSASDTFERRAKKNSPLNRKHRPSDPGGRWRRGIRLRFFGNQFGSGFEATNVAPHAIYVERGRTGSRKPQFFSWARANYDKHGVRPGQARWWLSTGPRRGTRLMERVFTEVTIRRSRG